MNYEQTITYLFNSLPVYQRIGKAAYKANLHNTILLDEYFKEPHKAFKCIHIAGTNGKGSVAHMLAAVLQKAGYKTGLYTSPHLFDFRERIKINGEPISQQEVIDFVVEHKSFFEGIKPSFFEMTVAMAFERFRHHKVDVALIETGLGGRLDSTNIITPILSVITNIGLDHTQFLGSTLDAIAKEKAGIIKPQIPVVIGETHKETKDVFINKAQDSGSPIVFADQVLSAAIIESNFKQQTLRVNQQEYTLDLSGPYQIKNLQTTLVALNLLKESLHINETDITEGLKQVKTLTGLRGRWDVLSENPTILCETSHNIDGISALSNKLEELAPSQIHIILGMVNDKDINGILRLLPKSVHYYFTRATIERALPARDLARYAFKLGLKGKCFEDYRLAIKTALENADKSDIIIITGSIFLVADALSYFDKDAS